MGVPTSVTAPGAVARTVSERRIPMSKPGCQRPLSYPNGDVMVPSAGHTNSNGAGPSVIAEADVQKPSAATNAATSRRPLPMSAQQSSSENLGAPRVQAVAENPVGAVDCARRQLLDDVRLGERREFYNAEVDRAKDAHIAAEIRRVLCALCGSAGEAPAPLVPGTE